MPIDKLSANAFATGAIANSLGYTPANLAGDNFTGNVGINNSTPAVLANTLQLAIKANVNGDSMFVAQNSNGLTTAKFGFQYSGSVDNPVIGSYSNHPLLFLTNNTEKMRIAANGNVGIGTSSPSSPFIVRSGSYDRLYLGSGIYDGVIVGRRLADDAYATLQLVSGGATNPKIEGAGESFGIFTGGSTRIAISNTGVTAIQFASSQSASADANTLDDYEEGSWTPTFNGTSSNGSVINNASAGRYIKIGGVVWIHCQLHFQCATAGSGSFYIGGLPFTASNINGHGQALALGPLYNWNVDNSAYQIGARVNDGSAIIYFWNNFDATGDSQLAWPFAGGNSQVYGSITGCYSTGIA